MATPYLRKGRGNSRGVQGGGKACVTLELRLSIIGESKKKQAEKGAVENQKMAEGFRHSTITICECKGTKGGEALGGKRAVTSGKRLVKPKALHLR